MNWISFASVTKETFEKIVEKAFSLLPQEFAGRLENIEVTIEDVPSFSRGKNILILGLYQGVPLERRGSYYAGALPDKITLYRKNIEAVCSTEDEMIDQIKRTLLHEIGHYFGISDKRLRELGY